MGEMQSQFNDLWLLIVTWIQNRYEERVEAIFGKPHRQPSTGSLLRRWHTLHPCGYPSGDWGTPYPQRRQATPAASSDCGGDSVTDACRCSVADACR